MNYNSLIQERWQRAQAFQNEGSGSFLPEKKPRPEEILAEGGENPERVVEEGYKYQNTS